MVKIKIALIVLLFSLFSFPTMAKIEKCQDKDGKWHYGSGLGSECENSSGIKQVKETVTTGTTALPRDTDDEGELAAIELKLVGQTEYLKSDIDKVLAGYETQQDVQRKYSALKSTTTNQVDEKLSLIRGLNSENKRLRIEKKNEVDVEKVKQIELKIADNTLRISTSQTDVSALNEKLDQIEQRRTKVLELFKQFFGNK